MATPTRYGIMSAGKISHDFVCAMSTLDPKEHQVVAVAARNLESAQKFATEHKIPKAYGSYEELVKDADVEIIYIGSINPTHLNLGKLALGHGKHVLCEKPLCINVKETKELLGYAKSKKLFLMEAIWSRSFPSYKKLKEEILKGAIGEVKQVLVTFGVPIADVDRIKMKELGGGTILDIGIYCIQFALHVFGEKPLQIIAGGHKNSEGVDESTSTTLLFSGGRTATLVTNSHVKLPNEAFAIGTKGTLKLGEPFWCSTTLETPTGTEEFKLPEMEGKRINFWNSAGLAYQCHEVRRCIQQGLVESPVVSHEETLTIAEIMESVRKQIGVVYPQDS